VRQVRRLLRSAPIVAILGPRQVGKTTLARQVAGTPATWFDLEDSRDASRLADPMLALPPLRGLVVIDEVQHVPELFRTLRVLADRPRTPARFLVLGSASPDLLRQSSESLAGRIAFHALTGLSVAEVGGRNLERLWLRGGFPRSFLARTEADSVRWRTDFVETFLHRDLPQFGLAIPAPTLRRFWAMLAHWHGQIWNSSEFARAFGVSDTTVRRYLDALTATFMVRQLAPWSENLAKRQVKAPKIYLADSGILHRLLDIRNGHALEGHPKIGASWEGFALSQIIERLGARSDECHFWATYQGAELDLLVVRGRERRGFEFKRASSPSATKSMHVALADLRLPQIDVIHAGHGTFPLAKGIRAVALDRILRDVQPLGKG